MRWAKRAGIGLAIVLVLGLLLPLFVPTRAYIPQIEKLASDKLGMPVKIGSLSLALLPLPAATVKSLEIGKKPIRIEAVTVKPAMLSLLSDTKVLRVVEISGVTVNDESIGMISSLASKPASPGPTPVRVNRVYLDGIQLELKALKWGPLFADVQLGEQGPEEIEAGTEDKHFKLTLTPGKGAQQLQVKASKWALPITATPLKFDALTMAGDWQGKQLKLPVIDGKLYGGTLKGDMRANWEKGWKVGGNAQLNSVEVKDIAAQLSPKTRVSGRLTASGPYNMVAKDAGKLADALNATFKFKVADGVLHGFDLEKAVKSLATQGTRGGETKFDELSGVLYITGKNYRFTHLKVSSGVLQAAGEVNIAPNKQLSGTVNVAMTGTSSLVEIPLDVSGTISDPVILPNKAALAGAAAGTAVLGPGVGTSVGSKAGQFLEKLFK